MDEGRPRREPAAQLILKAAAAAFALFAAAAHGQQRPATPQDGYPNRPIRMLVAVPPASGADIVARAVAQKLTEHWQRPVVIDNRAGAGGTIAMGTVAQAEPDGYTLLVGSLGLVATATLLKKVAYDVRRAYEPIVQMTANPYVLLANLALPVHSVADLIAYAKGKPGALNYASSGNGSPTHLGMELFKSMAGVDMVHVPYKGVVQGVTDLVGGQIQVLFCSAITAMPYIKGGKVRALAATSSTRSAAFPTLPTVVESGLPGFEFTAAYALFAPAGTPLSIIQTLNREVGAIIRMSDIQEKLAADGAEAARPASVAEFRKAFLKEVNKWADFLKATRIKI